MGVEVTSPFGSKFRVLVSDSEPQAFWAYGAYGAVKVEHEGFEETAETYQAEKQHHKLRQLYAPSRSPKNFELRVLG